MLSKCNSCKHYAKTSVIQTNKLIFWWKIYTEKKIRNWFAFNTWTAHRLDIILNRFWVIEIADFRSLSSLSENTIIFFTKNNWTILFWFYRCFVVFIESFYLLQMVREMTSLTNWTPFWKTTDVSNSFVLFRYCCRRTVCFDRDSILNKLVDVCVSVFWLGWYGC